MRGKRGPPFNEQRPSWLRLSPPFLPCIVAPSRRSLLVPRGWQPSFTWAHWKVGDLFIRREDAGVEDFSLALLWNGELTGVRCCSLWFKAMMLFAQLNKKPLLLSQFPFPLKMRGLRNKSKFLFEGLGLRAVFAAQKGRHTMKNKYLNS